MGGALSDRRQIGLLERERELAQLDALVAGALGEGRFLVIEGPPGLGKTRLLEAACAAAAASLRVLTARGTELERDFPYSLVRQLFEPLLSAMEEAERQQLLAGAAVTARSALRLPEDDRHSATRVDDTFAVLHGLYWLTAALAEREPLLLAIDDLQWGDGASLDFLKFLLPRLGELPVLLAVACRPMDLGSSRALLRVVTDPAAAHLDPQPLSCQATSTLLGSELGKPADERFAAACHEVTGGNPFLLSELIRELSSRSIDPDAARSDLVFELAPDRVARTILMRLEPLSASARAVVRSLVVLGDDVDHSLVAALAGLDARTTLNGADELRAAALLDRGVSLRFIHPLVRTALYAATPGGERAAAHAQAVVLLRDRGAAPEQLAAHLLAGEARGDRQTVETLLDAGIRALAGGAPQSAIAYLLRAWREPAPADLRPAVLGPLMMATIRLADDSVFSAIEADVFAELERDPQLVATVAYPLAIWLALNGRVNQAVPLLERAVDAALTEQAFDRAFRLEARLSSFARRSPAEARSRVARYRDRVEPDSPDGRLAAALDAAWSMVHGTAGQGVGFARHALRDGKIFAEQPELLAPGWAMWALWAAGALDDAQVAAEHALDSARKRGAPIELGAAWWLRGRTAALRGDLAAAEADHRQAVHIARLGAVSGTLGMLAASLAGVLIDRGAYHEAALELRDVNETAQPVVWFSAGAGRARLLLAQGKLRQALEELLAAQRRLEDWGLDGAPFVQPRVSAARALVGLGDHARARELAEVELVHATRWGAAWPLARAQRALALAVGGADGIDLLREAVAVLETSPMALERARALADLGSALRRAKRRTEAREPLHDALELARRCGADGLAKQVHDELKVTGEKVPRFVSIGVESLTASERRVAEMAAAGMTNREIAQALFLTVKTIETHLSAVYGKLGIGSRRLLPRALDADQRDGSAPAPTSSRSAPR